MNNGSIINLEGDIASGGVQGYSAYEIAVQNGFIGTEEDFTNSFLTPDGYLKISSIVDDLMTSSTQRPLSANQGKVLSEKTQDNKDDINREIINRQNENASLQNQINSLTSGSPLKASTMSDMTDTTRIYLLITDGHWYYYDDTEWIDGGVYQSTEVNDGSVNYFKVSQNVGYGLDVEDMALKEGFSKAIITTYSRGAWGSTSQVSDDNINRVHSDLFQLTTETGLVILKSSDYQYSLQTYDLEGNYLSETGWMAHPYRNLSSDNKYRINVKRNDNGDMDSNSFSNSLPIIIVENPLKVNNVGYGVTKNIDDVFTLINGYSTSPTDLSRSTNNKRFTTEKVYFLKGTTFKVGMSTSQIGVIGIDENNNTIINTGYFDTSYSLDRDCYVIINGKKTSNGTISDTELSFMSKYIQVEQELNLDDIKDNREKIMKMEQTIKNSWSSINVEYFRVNNSSCTLVRIPKTSNNGKKIRPHVSLTSTNNELSGTKTSALNYSKRNSSLFVINGSLFNTTTLLPQGQTISKEEVLVDEPLNDLNGWVPNINECYPLCIDASGNLSSDYDKTVACATLLSNDITDCVCGWGCLIKNHTLNSEFFDPDTGYHSLDTKNPVQIIGQYQNGDYFTLTIDGDRGNVVNERGMTVMEVANVLLDRNVKFAYELDGGGSSETVLGNRQLNPIYELSEGRIVPTVIEFIEED